MKQVSKIWLFRFFSYEKAEAEMQLVGAWGNFIYKQSFLKNWFNNVIFLPIATRASV